jgi:Putative auto-transporter adhesin, head GIN domain
MRRCALAAVVLVAGGCSGSTTGSGHIVTVSRTVSGFSSIDLTGAATVTVAVGRATAVSISGDDNIVALIRADVRDGVLVISSKHGYKSDHMLHVRVATPALDGVTLKGSGTFTAAGIRATAFSLVLSGAGTLVLAGTVGTLDTTISGVGSAVLQHLTAKDAHVTLSGTGSVDVYVTGTLDATVNGVGSIVYSGHPARVESHVSGVGTIASA